MEIDLPHFPHTSSTFRSLNGCWTCKLRRKKCDETHPVCDTCSSLLITCHYGQTKPEWMDGGVKQEAMVERLKGEVRENAQHRPRRERSSYISAEIVIPQSGPKLHTAPRCDLMKATSDNPALETDTTNILRQRGTDCALISKNLRDNIGFGRSDTILFMFYLEHLFPFLFPFYNPPVLQGGRGWILEMMLSSPVVREAMLCQSSYFVSMSQGNVHSDAHAALETVLGRTGAAFTLLRQSLQLINSSNISDHLHGAVRIMTSIMQMQCFEVALSSFSNCQPHLNAGLALFKQLLDSTGSVEHPGSSFNLVICCLGPPTWVLPAEYVQVPSAEQAAFRFSSTLVILEDIIASTALQEPPKLYEYHQGLLHGNDGADPPINLESVIGCQNWVLLYIGEVAALDAWKQQCRRAGNLDIMELVHRATAINHALETHLEGLVTNRDTLSHEGASLLDVLKADYCQQSTSSANHHLLVTRIWAHAALLYLSTVVSGWQPASSEVKFHVDQVIGLLTNQLSPSALLRTMVWPFCVAGCLAEQAQEVHLRNMINELQPPSVFGTTRKALEIMENVWRDRSVGDTASRDLATCLRSQGDFVLLV